MLHEVLEPSGYSIAIGSHRSVGTVTNVRLDGTLDVSILSIVPRQDDSIDEYQGVRVFYHCQGALTAANGSFAFQVGDEVMLLHGKVNWEVEDQQISDEPYDGCATETLLPTAGRRRIEPIVIGFANGNLRLCSPPLIIAGYRCPEDQLIGRSLAWRNGNALESATPIANHDRYGQHTFLQVRYEPVDVEYLESRIDKHGDPIKVLTDHSMQFSIAVTRGYTQNELAQITIKNYVDVRVVDTEAFRLFSFSIAFDQSGAINYSSFSANFNEDFTKLYVVNATRPEVLAGTASGSIGYTVYERVVQDDLADVAWEVAASGTHTVEYWVEYAYVDRTGKIWGLMKYVTDGDNLQQEEYATININSGAVSSASKHSIGMTIVNDEIVPVFRDHARNPQQNYSVSEGNYPNQYCIGSSTFTLIDDGLQFVDEGEGDPNCAVSNPEICSYNCQGSPQSCFETYHYKQQWRYWHTSDHFTSNGSTLSIDVTYGDNDVSLISGDYYSFTSTIGSSPKTEGIVACAGGCAPLQCITLETTWEYDNRQEDSNKTCSIGSVNGCVNSSEVGSMVLRTGHKNERCAGPCVCEFVGLITSYVTDCNCSHSNFGLYSSIYWYKSYYSCAVLDTTVNEHELNKRTLHYPFNIDSAVGHNSFIAVDQVTSTRIVGSRYHIGSTPGFRLELNGNNIKDDIVSLTDFSEGNIHYVGFLF